MRVCKACGASLEHRHLNAKVCGRKCNYIVRNTDPKRKIIARNAVLRRQEKMKSDRRGRREVRQEKILNIFQKCEHCGETFFAKNFKKYCNKLCNDKKNAAARKEARREKSSTVCAHCSGPIDVSKRTGRKYCSVDCGKAASLENTKVRARQASIALAAMKSMNLM